MKIELIHASVPGRGRYRINGLYRSETLKRDLERALASSPGISGASANPVTGTLLITFGPERSHEEITSLLNSLLIESSGRSAVVKPAVNSGSKSDSNWHSVSATAVMDALQSRYTGLTEKEVRERQAGYGPNTLESLAVRPPGQIWLDQFRSLPVALLGLTAGLSLLTAGALDTVLILTTIGFNAVAGFAIDYRTERKIEMIWRLGRPEVPVMREGKVAKVPTDRIVPGDILVLTAGNYVAADARLLESSRLELDESVLTKKSENRVKSSVDTLPIETPVPERANMLHRGTVVLHGQGLAVVVAIGPDTELGKLRLQEILSRTPETRLERQLARLEKQLTTLGVLLCSMIFVIGLSRGYALLEILTLSVSLGGGAIPEGLATIAATTLSIGVSRARKHNVLIRKLNAVETLGSIETFCFDKAGMITIDRPSVTALFTGGKRFDVSDFRLIADGRVANLFSEKDPLFLIRLSVLCSRSRIEKRGGRFIFQGPSLDNAFMEYAAGAGLDIPAVRGEFPCLKAKSSGLRSRFLITLHSGKAGPLEGAGLIVVRGDASDLLPLCGWQLDDQSRIPLGGEDRNQIEQEVARLADLGSRVVGFAVKDNRFGRRSGGAGEPAEKEFTWAGFICLIDPIREGVKPLINSIQRAGIETVMLTEEPPTTAAVVGRKLELEKEGQIVTLDSPQLAEMDPEVAKALAKNVQIISHATAVQKEKIVKVLQSTGRQVAMSGDEMADIPSMIAADIGIAVGHAGKEMARDVAEVVLEENNLETMIVAVSYGRTIYNNIQKSVHYLLSTNLSEVFLVSIGMATGIGSPLNAMQLLWIDIISDTLPSFALSFEPPEPDVMQRSPRPEEKPIFELTDLSRMAFEGSVMAGSAFGAYSYGLLRYGEGARGGTIAFLSLGMSQVLHLQVCRSERPRFTGESNGIPDGGVRTNRILEWIFWGSLCVQGLTAAIPGLRTMLGMAPITLLDGAVAAGAAVVPMLVNDATKRKNVF